MPKTTKRYSTIGYVWGHCWGGGEVGYTAKQLKANDMKSIKEQAIEGIENKSLDTGMGFEKITGALLLVKIEDVITIDKKEYINTEYQNLVVGNIPGYAYQALDELTDCRGNII